MSITKSQGQKVHFSFIMKLSSLEAQFMKRYLHSLVRLFSLSSVFLWEEKRNREGIEITWKIKAKAKMKWKSLMIGRVNWLSGAVGKKEITGSCRKTSFKHKWRWMGTWPTGEFSPASYFINSNCHRLLHSQNSLHVANRREQTSKVYPGRFCQWK